MSKNDYTSETIVNSYIDAPEEAAPECVRPLLAVYKKLDVVRGVYDSLPQYAKSMEAVEDDMDRLLEAMKMMVEVTGATLVAKPIESVSVAAPIAPIAEPIVPKRREIARKLWIDEQYALAKAIAPRALVFAPTPAPIAPEPTAPKPIVQESTIQEPAAKELAVCVVPHTQIHLVPENHPMPGKPVGALTPARPHDAGNHPMPGKPVGAPTPARPQGVHANKPMPGAPLAEAFGDKLMGALSRKNG